MEGGWRWGQEGDSHRVGQELPRVPPVGLRESQGSRARQPALPSPHSQAPARCPEPAHGRGERGLFSCSQRSPETLAPQVPVMWGRGLLLPDYGFSRSQNPAAPLGSQHRAGGGRFSKKHPLFESLPHASSRRTIYCILSSINCQTLWGEVKRWQSGSQP